MTIHAQDRAAERYGISIDYAEMKRLTERLVDGEGVLKKVLPDGVEDRYITTSDGDRIVARFRVASGTLMTVLPARNIILGECRRRRVGNHKRSRTSGRRKREGRKPDLADIEA